MTDDGILKEAKAVAGLEPEMDGYEEILKNRAKKYRYEKRRRRQERREEYDREKRLRERNFQRMVL